MDRPSYVPAGISDEAVAFMRRCGVIRVDGEFDIEQAVKELSDFHVMVEEVPTVYMHVTGGLVGKHLTKAEHVIRFADENEELRTADAIKEATEELRDEIEDANTRIAAVEAHLAALREACQLTGEEQDSLLDGDVTAVFDAVGARIQAVLLSVTAAKEQDPPAILPEGWEQRLLDGDAAKGGG